MPAASHMSKGQVWQGEKDFWESAGSEPASFVQTDGKVESRSWLGRGPLIELQMQKGYLVY